MAFDSIAVRCLTEELKNSIVGGRIDKIHQPERDEIIIHIRTFTDNYKLVLSASSAHPRIHFTEHAKKNPLTAPMFCMLLRKHIGSGKITAVEQIGFERSVCIHVDSYDELGDLTEKRLYTEIMGRHSNIILTDADGKILDCIKHVDFTVSSVRQVLPGLQYEAPPAQEKTALTDFTPETRLDFTLPQRADKAILSQIAGISPLTARETVYRAFHRTDITSAELNLNKQSALKTELSHLADEVKNNEFKPCMVTEASTGKILDFSAIDIKQYESLAEITYFESMSALLDSFYNTRDMRERMRQKTADLVKLLNNAIERVSKKLVILNNTLNDAENKEKYKVYGDLLTANIYKITEGQSFVEVENYYEAGMPKVTIPLDARLSPSGNAQRYYKRYNKAKTAETEAAKQAESARADLEYLESTLCALENAETEEDVNLIRSELIAEGYLNRRQNPSKKRSAAAKPRHFVSSDGFDIYVGRNNTQNDYLTLRFANSSDIWFHTKNIHGSHTVIKLGLDKNVPERTMREAAEYAAYYSKARSSSQVPVDYTQVKNVKKPNGAKPGMVIYDRYNTVYVTPKEPKEQKESVVKK